MTDPLKQLLKVAPDDARDIKVADEEADVKEKVAELMNIMKGYTHTQKLLAISKVAKVLAESSKEKE